MALTLARQPISRVPWQEQQYSWNRPGLLLMQDRLLMQELTTASPHCSINKDEAATARQRGGSHMSWTEYLLQYAASAERKARELSGPAREKQKIVAATFRAMARHRQFVERLEAR